MAHPPAPAAPPAAHGIRAWLLAVSLSATVPMLALLVSVTLWLQHQQGLQRDASLQRQALRAADAVASALATQRARIATVAVGVAAREQRLEVLHQVLQAVAATDPAITSISFVDAQGRARDRQSHALRPALAAVGGALDGPACDAHGRGRGLPADHGFDLRAPGGGRGRAGAR